MGTNFRFYVQERMHPAPADAYWMTRARFEVPKCYEFTNALPLIREEPYDPHSDEREEWGSYFGACHILEAAMTLRLLGRARELIPATPLLALRSYLDALTMYQPPRLNRAGVSVYRFAVWGS